MSTRWPTQSHSMPDRARRSFVARVWRIKLYHRIDLVLLVTIASLIAMILVAGLLGSKAYQWLLGPSEVQFLADERILTNVRENIKEHGLLDAVLHTADGRVYIAKDGGTIHRYDPDTGLWGEERPFQPGGPVDPNLVMLRSGCGNSPFSEDSPACPDSESLWGVSQSGGLVRRAGDGWHIVIGDTSFNGASGLPVPEEILTAAAVSPDQRWVVLGTSGEGIGIYNTTESIWRSLPQGFLQDLPSLDVTHLVYWSDRFWLGTANGLASLRVDESGQEWIPVMDPVGEVLDLDADKNLWVLRRRACEDDRDDCLHLSKFRDPDGDSAVLVEETHRFPDLQLSDLTFAQQWGSQLVVAGRAGIFVYDSTSHDWKQLSTDQIQTTLPARGRDGFYFGFDGGAGLLIRGKEGEISRWSMPEERISQLLYAGLDVLTMTQGGNVYALDRDDEVTPVYLVTQTAFDTAEFHAAVSVGTVMLFIGPEGILVHDIAQRGYEDALATDLPKWATKDSTRFTKLGRHLYGITAPRSGQTLVYVMDTDKLGNADDLTTEFHAANEATIGSTVSEIWPWGQTGIGLLGRDSRVYLVTPTDWRQLTGAGQPALDGVPFLDLVENDGSLLAATSSGLYQYDMTMRDWGDLQHPPADKIATELTVFQDQLLMRTDANRLVVDSASDPLLIGSGSGFNISDKGLSDAVRQGNLMFLAGEGQVESYDLDLRRIVRRWSTSILGKLAIEAIVNREPLTLGEGRAYLGSKALDPEAGAVSSISVGGGRIWTVRDKEDVRYVKSYSESSPTLASATCLFRNPVAIGASQFVDARALPNGLIAVTSDYGLHFYSLDARSWYAADTPLNLANSRAYVVGSRLVLTHLNDPSGVTLATVSLDSINAPRSCETRSVSIKLADVSTVAVSIDEGNGRYARLDHDGRVVEVSNGRSRQVLAPSSQGPKPRELRRVFTHNNNLFFTTGDEIWRYVLGKHIWDRIEIENGPNRVDDITIEADGARALVTIRGQDGDFYLGNLDLSSSKVAARKVYTPGTATFGHSGAELLDVQQRGNSLWTFLLRDRIKYFDPINRKWLPDGLLGAPDSSLYYAEALGRGVAVGNNDKSWWIAQGNSRAPTSFSRYEIRGNAIYTALDGSGQVWSLGGDGHLLLCTPGAGDDYVCKSSGSDPFLMNPNDVQQAIHWKGLSLFEFPDGFRAYDPGNATEVSLPKEADIRDVFQERQLNGRLWLWDGLTLVILSSDSGRVEADRIEQARALIVDADGAHWVQTNEGWRVWRNGRFALPVTNGGQSAEDVGLNLFIAELSDPTAIDSIGFPYIWQSGEFVPGELPLPSDLPISSIKGLWPTQSKNWWARIDDTRLAYFIRQDCYVDHTDDPQFDPFEILPDPCLVEDGHVELPAGMILPESEEIHAVPGEGTLELRMLDGTRIQVDLTGGNTEESVKVIQSEPIEKTGAVANQWPELRRNGRRLANGDWAYDPITELRVETTGRLTAVRSLSLMHLDDQGAVKLNMPPALDAGWIQWDRGQDRFQVKIEGGQVSYTPRQFISGKELLFEPVSSMLATGTDEIHVANRHGIWTYPNSNLRLNDPSITFQSARLGLPITAAHGRFFGENAGVSLSIKNRTTPFQYYAISFSGVQLTETLPGGGITGTYQSDLPVFGASGFVWDSGRRGLAYSGGTLFLHSDAGIHPADGHVDIDTEPSRILPGDFTILSENNGPLHIQRDDFFFLRSSSGQFPSAPNPADDRMLLDIAAWRWSFRSNRLEVDVTGSGKLIGHLTYGKGYGLASDRLGAAAWHDGNLFVMTDAFLEIGGEPEIRSLRAVRHASQPSEVLDPIEVNGNVELFRSHRSVTTRWYDDSSTPFRVDPSATDPYRWRKLAETGRIRLTLNDGAVQKEIRLNGLARNSKWVQFNFSDGHFPSDVVTSLDSYQDKLYVGTRAGLQVYSSLQNLRLNQVDALYDMRGSEQKPVPVDLAGVPHADPSLFMARSAGACIEKLGGQPFVPCEDPSLLNQRLILDTSFWYWTARAGQGVTGRYRDQHGNISNTDANIVNGRFPHDLIRAATVCDGEFHQLWQVSWLTTTPSQNLALNNQARHYDISDVSPDGLACVDTQVSSGGHTIASGLYLRAGPSQFWRWESGQGKPLAEGGQRSAQVEYLSYPSIYQRDNLRLRTPRGDDGFVFEYGDSSGQWRDLEWNPSGRLAIDTWKALVWTANGLWAATSEGLVPFEKNRSGQPPLDSSSLLVVRGPLVDGDPCLASNLEPEGLDVLLRCSPHDLGVYRVRLRRGSDQGNFEKLDSDPIAETTLIDSDTVDYWQWRRTGRVNGRPGRLEATFRGEDIVLIGGRFPFDALNSLELFSPQLVDLSTDTGGWYQAPREEVKAAALLRPKRQDLDPSRVISLAHTMVEDSIRLCVGTEDGNFTLISTEGDVDPSSKCKEYLGQDTLWRYSLDGGRLDMSSLYGEGGIGTRRMENGQFGDDLVIGPPATWRNGDQIMYLVPTKAGVVFLNAEFRKSQIHLPPFEGLPEDLSPTAVLVIDRESPKPVYAGNGQFYSLDMHRNAETGLPNWKDQPLPIAANLGPQNLLTLEWSDAGAFRWAVASMDQTGALGGNLILTDVSSLESFPISRISQRNDISRHLWIEVSSDSLSVRFDGAASTIEVPLPSDSPVVSLVLLSDRLLLIQDQELLNVNLNKLVEHLVKQ